MKPLLMGMAHPADEIDRQEVLFEHREGTRTVESVTLSGEVPKGYRIYLSASGFEWVAEEWVDILWDGLTDIGMPSRVEMQLVDPSP